MSALGPTRIRDPAPGAGRHRLSQAAFRLREQVVQTTAQSRILIVVELRSCDADWSCSVRSERPERAAWQSPVVLSCQTFHERCSGDVIEITLRRARGYRCHSTRRAVGNLYLASIDPETCALDQARPAFDLRANVRLEFRSGLTRHVEALGFQFCPRIRVCVRSLWRPSRDLSPRRGRAGTNGQAKPDARRELIVARFFEGTSGRKRERAAAVTAIA